MKSVTIPTGVATAWSGTFRSFVDGDIFRESNIDLNAGDIAERLAYLKDKADAAGYLAADQTWTGSNTFAMGAAETFSVTGDNAAEFNNVTVNGSMSVQDIAVAAGISIAGTFAADYETLSDANGALSNALVHRVPTLTANRTYTLPGGTSFQMALLVRARTADAFTATLNATGPTVTMGVISASAAGWILVQRKAATGVWVVVAWGGTVTSIDTTV